MTATQSLTRCKCERAKSSTRASNQVTGKETTNHGTHSTLSTGLQIRNNAIDGVAYPAHPGLSSTIESQQNISHP